MWTWLFWRDATERAIRDAAGAALGVLGVNGLGVRAVGWVELGTVTGLAGVASLAMSLVGNRVGVRGTASLLPAARGRHARD